MALVWTILLSSEATASVRKDMKAQTVKQLHVSHDGLHYLSVVGHFTLEYCAHADATYSPVLSFLINLLFR